MAGQDTPELKDVIRATGVVERRFWTLVGIVDSYDADAITAVVKLTPQMRDRLSGRLYDLGPLTLPVRWMVFGGTGVSVVVQGELAKGDEVQITVPDADYRAWLTTGGVTAPTGKGRRLGGGWCEPMGLSALRKPSSAGGNLRIGRTDDTATIKIAITGDGQISITAPSVSIGAGAKLAVARDTDSITRDPAFETWQQAVSLAAGASPLGPGPIGSIAASSTEVESS